MHAKETNWVKVCGNLKKVQRYYTSIYVAERQGLIDHTARFVPKWNQCDSHRCSIDGTLE